MRSVPAKNRQSTEHRVQPTSPSVITLKVRETDVQQRRVPTVAAATSFCPTNIAFVGGTWKINFLLKGPSVRCHINGREDESF